MPHPSDPHRTIRFTSRSVSLLLATAVCLTLLFTVQDAVRRGARGMAADWPHAFALNGLDWIAWAACVPALLYIGERIRVDGAQNRVGRLAGWLLLAIAFCSVQSLLTGLVIRYTQPQFFGFGGPGGPPDMTTLPLGQYLWTWGLATSTLNLLLFGMTAAGIHALLYSRDLRDRQLREADLQARLAHAELNVLRMQLQPHFLFNTLHTVSSLMVSDVPAAQRVVSALGDLLRSSLEHTGSQEISLRAEIGFVERFLDIQRARFRNRLAVDVQVPDVLLDALVPSFVLQPLVENAIRHGIEPRADGGRIWIHAARAADVLTLTVRDDGGNTDSNGTGGSGIGLANIEARLQQLYGTGQNFRAARDEEGRFEVRVTLPFHTIAGLYPSAAAAS